MFNYNDYLDALFAVNQTDTPNELWNLVVNDLTDAEKVAVFDATGRSYLQSYRLQWLARRTAPQSATDWSPKPRPAIEVPRGRTASANGAAYVAAHELDYPHCTHNGARKESHVPLRQWTVVDLKCYEDFHSGIAGSHRHSAKRARDLQTVMMDYSAETLGDIWDTPERQEIGGFI